MPSCNGKACTVTRYYFEKDVYGIKSAVSSDGGPRITNDQAKTALEASESWRSTVVGVGYDPARGTRFPPVPPTRRFWEISDYNTCDDGCHCVMDAPFTPTIKPNKMEQRFSFDGVPRGNPSKTYRIIIKASCWVWDFPGTCRPDVVKTAYAKQPKYEYVAMLKEVDFLKTSKLSTRSASKTKIRAKPKKTKRSKRRI